MKSKFRVLLIDDTKEVLDHLQSILRQDINVGNLSIKINVETLHVTLEQIAGGADYQITEQTIKDLGIISGEKFDYIFSDFGFVGNRTRGEELRQNLLDKGLGVEESDIKGLVLQLRDIKKRYDEMCLRNALSNETQNRINENFINHKGSILVYTNSPKPFDNYFNSNQKPVRINEVKYVFQQSKKVDFILMHDEFSINHEIESLFPTVDARKKFYSQLLSKRINSLMQYVALEHIIMSQDKLRISKTDQAFKTLTAWAIGFGAAVAVFGEVLFHFAHTTIALAMKKLGIEYNLNLWLNLGMTLLLIFTAWKLFSKMGVKFAEKTEQEVDKVTQKKQ